MRRFGLLLLALLVALPAAAQAPVPVRIRGAIETLERDSLFVRSREGATFKIDLARNLSVHAVMPTALGAVDSGKLLGVAGMNRPDGRLQAIEVVVFPDALRAAAEGLPWDLPPRASMINGMVSSLVERTNGRELTLSVNGTPLQVLVPAEVPVVTLAPGDRTLLAPGAYVVMAAERAANGSLSSGRLVVGKDGYAPPM